ncbi:MAG: leucine-rich repeat protein [Eubacteriales bacterium]
MKVFQDFDYDIQYDYADYQKKEGKRDYAVVFKYMGNETKVTVPSEIEGFPVISMSDSFTSREEMEEIILPEQLERISYGCFRDCKKITKITLPETLISIGTEAFSGCTSLEEILCPETPEWLDNISLGNRDLGQNIFENCPKLCDVKGFVLLHSLLAGYDGRNTEISIPKGVTKLADFTFWEQKKLKSVTVPDSVKTLGNGVFFKCQGLEEINLPDGIKIFPNETFRRCTSLKSIVFPEKLEEIHHDVFHGCSKLQNIQWNENLKFFWDGNF